MQYILPVHQLPHVQQCLHNGNGYRYGTAGGFYTQIVADITAVMGKLLGGYVAKTQQRSQLYDLAVFTGNADTKITRQITPLYVGSAAEGQIRMMRLRPRNHEMHRYVFLSWFISSVVQQPITWERRLLNSGQGTTSSLIQEVFTAIGMPGIFKL